MKTTRREFLKRTALCGVKTFTSQHLFMENVGRPVRNAP